MASILPSGKGRWAIQFKNNKGKRPTLRLGKCDRSYAEEAKRHIEHLLSCQLHNRAPYIVTAVWLNQLSSTMLARFAKAGIIDDIPPTSIAELCDYCMQHFGGKKGTQTNYRHAKHDLCTFFKLTRAIHTVTEGDVLEYRKWSLTSGKRAGKGKGGGLADTTSSKRCKVAKQFFGFAVKKNWLRSNPFDCLKGLVDSNDERQAFISDAMIREILSVTSDPELRLIIALVRFGGLRFPSEVEHLQLDWIDRERETIKIYSPKTERYRGKKWRTIPMFARLRPFIDEAFERMPDGASSLMSLTAKSQAYTHRMQRTIIRAKYEVWPKVWHNLRSSLQTELEEQGFSLIAITKWLGNTPSVAKKHYLQVTKEQHRRAVEGDGLPATPTSDAKSGAKLSANQSQREPN